MLINSVLFLPAQAIGMSFCPESPVWLEWKGKTEEAWRARGQLQGQVPSALPQISNLAATHFSDVEKRETTAFDEEAAGMAEPLRPSDDGGILSEAESSYLVCSQFSQNLQDSALHLSAAIANVIDIQQGSSTLHSFTCSPCLSIPAKFC